MMINRRVRGLEIIHCVLQTGLTVALYAAWMALPLPLSVGDSLTGLTNYQMYGFAAALALVLDCSLSKGRELLDLKPLQNFRLSLRQCLFVLFFILFYAALVKDQSFSRLFLGSYLGILALTLYVSNLVLPTCFARLVFGRKRDQRRVIIVGTCQKAEELSSWLHKKRSLGVHIVGLVTDEPNPESAFTLLGNSEDLLGAIVEHRVTQVILLEPPAKLEEIYALMELCEQGGARMMVLSDWQQRLGRSLAIDRYGGLQMLSFQAEPLQSPWNRILKRCFDLSVAIPVVLLMLPLASMAVWIIHRLQSPGPLFFRQMRIGMSGQPFLICKYRTMHVNNEEQSRQATADDERVFRLGRWLRKLSIDELPQFLNVLVGNMSVVGPRPHMIEHDEDFSKTARSYRVRHMVKPGITGLAQITGFRGETKCSDDIVGRVKSDLCYLETWSLWLDSLIVLRTFSQIVKPPRNAY